MLTQTKTMAKNIICGKEVEVTVVAKYSETQTEVLFDGRMLVVQNKDLIVEDVDIVEVKANEVVNYLESFGIRSTQDYTGDGSIDVTFGNDKQMFWKDGKWCASEIITVVVYADHYEVETLNAEKEYKNRFGIDNEYVESANRRVIKKFSTLASWFAKRMV